MAAANTDKLKKVARKWVGQVGAGGVTDAAVTTVPLASATNLPTDTAVVATIDRVDANGVKTPTLEESVIGVVSGSNLTNCVRGSEGTAQAHAAGAVVEILLTAKGWNDIIDAFLVAFNQDGTIKDGTVLTTPQINNLASTYQYVITPSAITADRIATLPLLAAGDTFTFNATTQTLTNKRITKRVVTTTDDATAVINTDITDVYELSAIANATEFTLTGTPTDGQTLVIRFKDAGVSKALTWTGFTEVGVTLPTATTAGKQHVVGCMYNDAESEWQVLAVAEEA
jgi:hypothetical protein